MTGKQFEKAIAQLGLSQRKAGPWLGFTDRQARRIVAGEAELPLSAEKLLRVMLQLGLTVEQVDQLAAPQTKKEPHRPKGQRG